MALTPQYLSIYSGTSKAFPLTLTQDDGATPLNLTGYTSIVFDAKRGIVDSDGAAAITKGVGTGIVVANAATGQITLSLVPLDSAGQEGAPVLTWAIKVTYSSTNEAIGGIGTLTLLASAVAGV